MPGDYSNPSAQTQKKLNKVAEGLVQGKKKRDALVDAGYGPTNARAMAAAKKTLAGHLDDVGITDEVLAQKIEEALRCTMPLSFRGELTGHEAPDWKARIRALELVSELKGHRPGRDFRDDHDRPLNISVNFGGTVSTAPPAREEGFVVQVGQKDPKELPPGPGESPD